MPNTTSRVPRRVVSLPPTTRGKYYLVSADPGFSQPPATPKCPRSDAVLVDLVTPFLAITFYWTLAF